MESTKTNINIAVVTFSGLSAARLRYFSVGATIFLYILLFTMLFWSSTLVPDTQQATDLLLIFIMGSVLYYVFGGKFIFHEIALAIFNLMPMTVLLRNDMAILDAARKELFRVANHYDVEAFLPLAKVNPAIQKQDSDLIVALQQRGILENWLNDVRNLKTMANFVYQVHLAENVLKDDRQVIDQG